jgi:GNAT superfamily N-acetyltransferase
MADLPRPMMKVDVDALAALWHDAWHRSHGQLVPRDVCDFRDEEYFRRRLEKEPDSVRVLGQPGNLTGLCIVHGANLDMLFIALNEQGKGLGEQLLSDAESRMRGSGLEEAYLHVALDCGTSYMGQNLDSANFRKSHSQDTYLGGRRFRR